jgi:PKD repeat protein
VVTNTEGEARDTLVVSASDVATLTDETFTVRAQAAGSSGNLLEEEAEITVGARAASITLQASPSSVPETGGNIELLALVRNTQGTPLANAAVNFRTEVGTLASGGSVKFTNAKGEVRDTLRVSAENLSAINEDRFEVSALVGGSGGSLISSDFLIRIQRAAPTAAFNAHAAGGNSVFFENTTTGTEPITFAWDFQSDGVIDSTVRNPTFNYGSPGSYTVRLEASNSSGSDVEIRTIAVPID